MGCDDDDYWPPARETLHRMTIDVLSLHNLPKRRERRPRYDGSRGACHNYHPELSGNPAPPDNLKPSTPELTLSLHPIGGTPLTARAAHLHILVTFAQPVEPRSRWTAPHNRLALPTWQAFVQFAKRCHCGSHWQPKPARLPSSRAAA